MNSSTNVLERNGLFKYFNEQAFNILHFASESFIFNKIMSFRFAVILSGVFWLCGLNAQQSNLTNDIVCRKDLLFSVAGDWKGRVDSLKVDLVYPVNYDSAELLHPLILFFHGGSLLTGNKKDYFEHCILLAQQGCVAASVNYRLGYLQKAGVTCKDALHPSYFMAEYRAQQDVCSAIRFFVLHAKEYHVDTNQIVIAGFSSGADACLLAAFCGQDDWQKKAPWVENVLGKVDAFGMQHKVKVVASLWGAVTDLAFITPDEAQRTAAIFYQGTLDPAVPYDKTAVEYGTAFYGAHAMAGQYKRFQGCYQLNTHLNGGHMDGYSKAELTRSVFDFAKAAFAGNCVSSEKVLVRDVDRSKINGFIVIFIAVTLLVLVAFYKKIFYR